MLIGVFMFALLLLLLLALVLALLLETMLPEIVLKLGDFKLVLHIEEEAEEEIVEISIVLDLVK